MDKESVVCIYGGLLPSRKKWNPVIYNLDRARENNAM